MMLIRMVYAWLAVATAALALGGDATIPIIAAVVCAVGDQVVREVEKLLAGKTP